MSKQHPCVNSGSSPQGTFRRALGGPRALVKPNPARQQNSAAPPSLGFCAWCALHALPGRSPAVRPASARDLPSNCQQRSESVQRPAGGIHLARLHGRAALQIFRRAAGCIFAGSPRVHAFLCFCVCVSPCARHYNVGLLPVDRIPVLLKKVSLTMGIRANAGRATLTPSWP